MRTLRIHGVAALALATLWGCGGNPDATSSTQSATVKGTVNINGKPATGGEVVFNPANINRPDAPTAKSPIGKDGSYSVETLVGENSIMVQGPDVQAAKIDMPRTFLDVKSGENTFAINLP